MAGDDDYEIPESGAVFTFGRSRFADNLSSHFFIRNDPVLEISCGDEHTALVCKSGRVFLFGNNDYGQLGFGHTKVVNKPSCLKYLKPFHSTHVACGKGHTIISTACNRIFTFGCNSDGQLGVGDLNDRVVPQMLTLELLEDDKIIAVSAGCHHSAFLTEKGDVYLWGSNSDGQCGVENESYIATPKKLEFDSPISALSCGYYHTAFISLGYAYTFGEEDNGKLGHPSKSSKNIPEKVPIPEASALVKCGGSHTLVLAESKTIYAFGSNFSGQLGIGNSETESSTPLKLEFPESNTVIYMSCGESHSAFVTDKGALFTCGDSRHGKLCNEDDSTNYTKPTLISLLETYFCTSVSCGGCHTMVLAKVRNPDNQLDIALASTKKEVLPPLKPESDVLELPKTTEVLNTNNTDHEKVQLQNNEDNEECDSKSNTESNLNNEEVISQADEIYTEIREIETIREDESKIEWDSKTSDRHETNGNDLVVAGNEGPLKKLIKVFKRKKSASAILLIDKSESKGTKCETEENEVTGNQHKSKACILL